MTHIACTCKTKKNCIIIQNYNNVITYCFILYIKNFTISLHLYNIIYLHVFYTIIIIFQLNGGETVRVDTEIWSQRIILQTGPADFVAEVVKEHKAWTSCDHFTMQCSVLYNTVLVNACAVF